MQKLIGFLLLLAPLFAFAKDIANSADEVSPLLNGQTIPAVSVTTIDGENLSLEQYLNGQKAILFFYRGGWCPFCNTQLGQIKQVERRLKQLGFKLIGISTDSPVGLKESLEQHKLNYDLLSDAGNNVSKAFGLAFFADEKTTKRYVSKMNLQGLLQKNPQGEDRLVLPVPAVYVLDSKGLVQFSYVNPNFKVRLNEHLLVKAAELVK